MDKEEARGILRSEISRLRAISYAELPQYFESVHKEVTAPSGKQYQIEIQAFYDSKEGRDIRVIASIDDGGWRAFVPMSEDFVVAPDGSFVGEQSICRSK